MKNLNEIVQEILKNKAEKLTTKEIALIIKNNYYDFYEEKMINNKRDDKGNFRQIRAEIAGHYSQLNKNYNIYRTMENPQKYYFSIEENLYDDFSQCRQEKSNTPKKPEYALYPLFLDYCQSKGIEAMRLDDTKSKKNRGKGYNIWMHPDIIGYVDLVNDFEDKTKLFMADCPCDKFELYSFEIKDEEVDMGNLKEWFFQTVSNSSWANYSYLVAEGVKDDDVMQELELLCKSYKIGFIKFKKSEVEKDIENGKILIQAQKTNVDWKMIDRLAKLHNDDFDKYLKTLTALNMHHKNQNSAYPKSFFEP